MIKVWIEERTSSTSTRKGVGVNEIRTQVADRAEYPRTMGLRCHVDFDSELKRWVERKPRNMERMRVEVSVLIKDHKKLHQTRAGWPWLYDGTHQE